MIKLNDTTIALLLSIYTSGSRHYSFISTYSLKELEFHSLVISEVDDKASPEFRTFKVLTPAGKELAERILIAARGVM